MRSRKAKRIILDERIEAERILSSEPEKYITFRTMLLLGKYFYSFGLSNREVKKKLCDYCVKSEGFNFVLRGFTIDKALKKAKMYNLKSSDYRIPITEKEILKLKVLPHKDYRLALYIIFITKLEHFQKLTNDKVKSKAKSFTPYFNHDLKTAFYNFNTVTKSNNKGVSAKEELEILHRLCMAKIIEPTYRKSLIVKCIDFDNSRNIEFIIDASKDFISQIQYYCMSCGDKVDKTKKNNYCSNCYRLELRLNKTNTMRKIRNPSVVK